MGPDNARSPLLYKDYRLFDGYRLRGKLNWGMGLQLC